MKSHVFEPTEALAQCVEVVSVSNDAWTGVRAFEDEVAEVASFAITSDQIADVLLAGDDASHPLDEPTQTAPDRPIGRPNSRPLESSCEL